MQKLTEQVIVDIIGQYMEIPANNIWVSNQNRKIPGDDGLYIIVGMEYSTLYSAQRPQLEEVLVPNPPGDPVLQVWEVQKKQMREVIKVDILSRSNAAVERKSEIVFALNSILAQQKQEANAFKIGRVTDSFVNASIAEGGSQLNRFSLSFACLTWYLKKKLLPYSAGMYDYYNDFDTRVDDAKTIGEEHGLIEFNIKEGA